MTYDDDEVRLWIQTVGLLHAGEVPEGEVEAVRDAVAGLLSHPGMSELPLEIRRMVGEALETGYATALADLGKKRSTGLATDARS